MAETPLYDMHCHLGFCEDPATVVHELAERNVAGGLCCTVTPDEHERVAPLLSDACGWRVGVGCHPWWAGELGDSDIGRAVQLVSQGPCLVGEVGLDFGTKHEATRERQLTALARILDAVQAGSVLSLHAVRSADVVLDLLEECGLTRSCTCILHWFSGTSTELHRAVQSGCRFSVGPLMLRSRRGREYARQLPLPQLLLETDYPDQTPRPPEETANEMSHALHDALSTIATLRGLDENTLRERLSANSEQIVSIGQ